MIKDDLGNRMKDNYENRSKTKLVRRMPVIIRLDGCHFHTFTKGFKKPFDPLLVKTMQETMKYLCQNIQGCKLGYTQSDEITLLLTDYDELTTDAWFDYQVQKVCSVAASLCTYAFNKYFNEFYLEDIANKCGELDKHDLAHDSARRKGAVFDARCFNIPVEEVVNCFLWRQLDAQRNSVSSLAQSLYSPKELHGLSSKNMVIKMKEEKGVSWEELPTTLKRGSCCIKQERLKEIEIVRNEDATKFSVLRPEWVIDNEIPEFKNEGREYIPLHYCHTIS